MTSAFLKIGERLEATEDGCWIWLGRRTSDGYGQTNFEGIEWMVHRLLYTLLRGPIPDGLEIDHLCRRRACANPFHCEAVTRQENLRRGEHANRNKTECSAGHPYTPDNTYQYPDGRRDCRTCRADRVRQAKQEPNPDPSVSASSSPERVIPAKTTNKAGTQGAEIAASGKQSAARNTPGVRRLARRKVAAAAPGSTPPA